MEEHHVLQTDAVLPYMLVLTFWCHSDARLRLFCFGYGPQNRAITHEFAEPTGDGRCPPTPHANSIRFRVGLLTE